MSTKRLRGWSLQKELATPHPCERDTPSSSSKSPSQLATKLLSLWAHGTLSAVMVQQIAHLALLDGASHSDLYTISKTGNFGQFTGNVHRDLMHEFAANICVDIHPVITTYVDPKSSTLEEGIATMLLPHVLFSNLEKGYTSRFDELFCGKDLESFWNGALEKEDERLLNHPCLMDSSDWKQKTIPIFIHGDGVEFQERDSLMVWSWGPLLSKASSLETNMLIGAIPKSCTASGTWSPLMQILVWSFNALLMGLHPSVDNFGNAFAKKSKFDLVKGQPLTHMGYRCVIWSIQGDHEFFSNTLGLPHWRRPSPCWECDALNLDDAPLEKWVKNLKPDLQNFNRVTHAMSVESPPSDHPLFGVPGVTSLMVRGDALHILYTKGVYGHLLGSILHYICWKNGPGRPQVVAPCKRLALIFTNIQKHYKELGSNTRLTNLRLSMFTSEKTPHANHAFLTAKGAECKHLAPALKKVCDDVFDIDNPVEKNMISALEGLIAVSDMFDTADVIPSNGDWLIMMAHINLFFDSYDALNAWALAEGRNLFHVVMKHHTLLHLIENAQFLNPKITWCFKSEDYVGKISRIGHSVAMGVRSTKLSEKVMAKYILMLHLCFTRGPNILDFDLDTDE